MNRSRYRYAIPGGLGAHNGGTDFNDIVHPAARAMVEGLFGLRPVSAALHAQCNDVKMSWPPLFENQIFTAGLTAIHPISEFTTWSIEYSFQTEVGGRDVYSQSVPTAALRLTVFDSNTSDQILYEHNTAIFFICWAEWF
jgi:hypothetical protein